MNSFSQIEAKWQKYWETNQVFKAHDYSKKPKYYILVEFPYPSGNGLHVGHVRSYTALDAYARYMRLKGYNVLFPMGWDAFGAPAEQYAIKNRVHPAQAVKANIKTYKKQIQLLGISFDWSREFATTDPDYYKWTQWQFLKFFEHDMAYKAKKNINWCPKCQTGLSNEEASGGVCERCGTKVVQKEKEQWMLKMSSYAEELLTGLQETNFAPRIKLNQINWIGKSVGAEIDFKVESSDEVIKVYTTRSDTLFGATFIVLAPEHPIVERLKTQLDNYDAIRQYQKEAQAKTAFERIELERSKTGVKLEGIRAINPVNNQAIEIWIADYVMMDYGTGAIMAVPAHDDRDYEFARKFKIPIIPVIASNDSLPYMGDGPHINSEFLNGLTQTAANAKMLDWLQAKKIGHPKTNYRLQDWVFSRQRFWGEPIPLIHCSHCGWVPVPETDLPVTLPDVAAYEPTADGESPLAQIKSWVNVVCPKCGRPAQRETDTMPNWAGSSWYFLRYMDPHNNRCLAAPSNLKYWGKVDWYDGGMEHTTRHLLYARFWNRFLYHIGLVPNSEPIDVRVSHGMILGANNEKMSKSKGNVVNPDALIKEFGADTLRVYEMFIGDYEKDAVWSTESLKGCQRFLAKVQRLQTKLNNQTGYTDEVIINQTIKKVSHDLENMKYNTIVSSLMILTGFYEKQTQITKADYRILLHLLNPIAPHITEELNEVNKLGRPICKSVWPSYDETKLVNTTKVIAVQINGKVRATIEIKNDEAVESIQQKALKPLNIQKHLANHEIVKIIVIKNKIVNIIVK